MSVNINSWKEKKITNARVVSKSVNSARELTISEVAWIISNKKVTKNNTNEIKKVRQYFRNRVLSLIDWKAGPLWKPIPVKQKINHTENIERTKLKRYYPMYHEYFIQRFKDEIEKLWHEPNEDELEDIMQNHIIQTFKDITSIYWYTLSPEKVWELILNPEKLVELLEKSQIEQQRYKDSPELLEVLLHQNEKVVLNDSKKEKEIENHFISSFESLIDIFNHWANSINPDKEILKIIIERISQRVKYAVELCKNKDAFTDISPETLNTALLWEAIENSWKKISNERVQLFIKLFDMWENTIESKIDFFISEVVYQRKQENSRFDNLNDLKGIEPENISFEELKNSQSVDRLRFFINKILCIWNDNTIQIPQNNLIQQFADFYFNKYNNHWLNQEDIHQILRDWIKSINEIKTKPISEQKNAFLDFVENKTEEFQILISWWRYNIMHKSLWWDKDKIKEQDSNLYWTKDLILWKLAEKWIDTDIVFSDVYNWSSWSLDKMLELDKKRFTHWDININDQNKFWLSDSTNDSEFKHNKSIWFVWNHTKLYILDDNDYDNNYIISKLYNSFIESELITNNTIKKIINNFIWYIISNNCDPNNIKEHIEAVLSKISDPKIKARAKTKMHRCTHFIERNYELTKIKYAHMELENRMNLCNRLLSWDFEGLSIQDNSFLMYLKEIKVIEESKWLITKVNKENLWKIRRFIKFIIKSSGDLSEMIKKSEEDRIYINRIIERWHFSRKLKWTKVDLWPRKKFERMLEKFIQNYNWDLRRLHDISRLRVTYDCDIMESANITAQFVKIVNDIQWFNVSQMYIWDNTWNPYERAKKPTWYRDVNLSLRLPSKNVIEVQFVLKDIEKYKKWIKAKDLLTSLKESHIRINQYELNKLIKNAEELKKKLPIEILEILEYEIDEKDKENPIFAEWITISSDDFYNLWRISKSDTQFVTKMQEIEWYQNKKIRWKYVRKSIENLFINWAI